MNQRLRVKLRRALNVAKDYAATKRDVFADLCESLEKKGPYEMVLYSSGNVEIRLHSEETVFGVQEELIHVDDLGY